tara:strand:- start:5212 stop:5421 length:210 start_codon:yes stop_codon:yes gene_type:complete
MFKPSLTIHKSVSGSISVLSCGEDADEAVLCYNACTKAGEVQLVIGGILQKQKKVQAKAKKAKSKQTSI